MDYLYIDQKFIQYSCINRTFFLVNDNNSTLGKKKGIYWLMELENLRSALKDITENL
jgi:hypothetical protein